MQMCQPRFEKTALFQQTIDTCMVGTIISMDDDTPTIAIRLRVLSIFPFWPAKKNWALASASGTVKIN